MTTKSRTTVAVSVERPNLPFTIAINTLMAVFTQGLFAALLLIPFREIWHASGLSSEGAYRLMTTAILISCGFTAVIMVAIGYFFEMAGILDDKKAHDKEAIRALYFSVIGMIGVSATKTFQADRILPTVILLIIVGLLLALGRYHQKFREARQGVWFPHTIFHYGVQQFIFFPAGLWIVGQVLNRAS